MGIFFKNRGELNIGKLGFNNGADFTTSTSDSVITASSGFTASSTISAPTLSISSAAAFTGATSVSSAGTFKVPNVSTASAPSTVGLIGWSTGSSKLVFAPSTSAWVIVSTA